MIRFSASLVAAAIVLLFVGVITSKLAFVYLAIGVSGVAAVSLAVGVFVRRTELFGDASAAAGRLAAGEAVDRHLALQFAEVTETRAGAGITPSESAPRGSWALGARGNPPEDSLAGGSRGARSVVPPGQHQHSPREGTVQEGAASSPQARTAEGAAGARAHVRTAPGAGTAWPDDSPIVQPPFPADARSPESTGQQPGGGAAGSDPSSVTGGSRDADDSPGDAPVGAVASPDTVMVQVVRGRRSYHEAGCRLLTGKYTEWYTQAEAHVQGYSPCSMCLPDQAAPAAGISNAGVPAAGVPRAGSPEPPEGRESPYGDLAQSVRSYLSAGAPARGPETAVPDEEPEVAEAHEEPAAAPAAAQVAEAELARGDDPPRPPRRGIARGDDASRPPRPPREGDADVPEAAEALEPDGAMKATLGERGEGDDAGHSDHTDAASSESDDTRAADPHAALLTDEPDQAPGEPDASARASGADEAGPAGVSAADAGEAPAAVSAAEPADSAAGSAESAARPGKDVAAETGKAAAAEVVTVVPGVPRYHRSGCILIRFLSDGDVESMTLPEAESADLTPCRACQPGISVDGLYGANATRG